MKKIYAFMLMACLLLSILPMKNAHAANALDSWATRDAEVTPFEYSYLFKNASIAAYVYTGINTKLQKTDSAYFTLVKKEKTFLLLEHISTGLNVMVTEKGLVVAFADKLDAPSPDLVDSFNESKTDSLYSVLQQAVQLYLNQKMGKAAYIDFDNLDSNQLLTISTSLFDAQVQIPEKTTINSFVTYQQNTYDEDKPRKVKYFDVDIFMPGETHYLELQVARIDNKYFSETSSSLGRNYISYTSPEKIQYTLDISYKQYSDRYGEFELTNNFKPVFKDVDASAWYHKDVSWAVLKGMIQGYEDGSFKPNNTLTESQFISLLTKYYSIKTSMDSNDYDPVVGYSFFSQYVALDGLHNTSKRAQPITRGKVAQALSATLGGPTDQNGAIQFLIDQNLSTVSSIKEFNGSSNIRRSHISAFFTRMNELNFTELHEK